jgi:hypothetical protein
MLRQGEGLLFMLGLRRGYNARMYATTSNINRINGLNQEIPKYMNKIQENLQEFMENPYTNIVSSGSFKVVDFTNLNKILNNTEDDFLIFDNAGGKKFEIVFDRTLPDKKGVDTLYKVKAFIKYLLKERKSWIYCYQLNKEQTVLRKII